METSVYNTYFMSGEIKELKKIMLDHEMCLSLLLSNINNCASHKLYFLSKIRNNIKPTLCIVNIQADYIPLLDYEVSY